MFVRARSPLGLRRAMLLQNAKAGAFHKYFDIQFVNGDWYAWFFKDVSGEDIDQMDTDETKKPAAE